MSTEIRTQYLVTSNDGKEYKFDNYESAIKFQDLFNRREQLKEYSDSLMKEVCAKILAYIKEYDCYPNSTHDIVLRNTSELLSNSLDVAKYEMRNSID